MNTLNKTLLTVAGVSLLFNLVWENAQAPLYQGYIGFWQHLPICGVASFGDVAIVLGLYFVMAIINRDTLWIAKMSAVNILIVIILGVLIAIGIEKWALVAGRWQYDSVMPLVPYIGVGLLPVLQMTFLPLIAYYISKRVSLFI